MSGGTMFPAPVMSDIAQEFFAKFSRVEFAMKRCPQFRMDNPLEADWTRLARSANIAPLFDVLRHDPQAEELILRPPKKLVLVAGSPNWGPAPAACGDMDAVCIAMRRARNNLFHGEKGVAVQPREQELLAAGLYVLDQILIAEAQVAQHYF